MDEVLANPDKYTAEQVDFANRVRPDIQKYIDELIENYEGPAESRFRSRQVWSTSDLSGRMPPRRRPMTATSAR